MSTIRSNWSAVALACAVFTGLAGVSFTRQQAAAAQAPAAVIAPAIQVVIVRHAEKGTDDPRDPSLSAAGAERAELLARTLALARPTHLFASDLVRTQQTLAPLARASGLEMAVRPAADVAGLSRELRGLPAGSVAVVAGHSNTVPALAKELGVELEALAPSGQLPDAEYGRMVVLTLPVCTGATATRLELRYGQ